VSEDLISQVVEQAGSARGGVRPKVIAFRPSAWIGAAAAVLLVGVLLLAPHMMKDETPAYDVEKSVSKPVVKMRPEKEMENMQDEDLDETVTVAQARSTDDKVAIEEWNFSIQAKYGAGITKTLSYLGKGEFGDEQISDQAPFAPASAIELVVLPRRDKVQLTIYNSADLTLVRERRNLTLKKGWNWLQFMWANTLIDPTSLSLEPLEQVGKIDIQQLVFPARLRELGRWLIRSEVSGQVPFEITYFTSGLSWRAFYMGKLTQDEKTMQLRGYVRVGNKSGEDYENSQTRLIVGKVHILDQIVALAKRQYPYDRPGIRAEMDRFGEGIGIDNLLVRDHYFYGGARGSGGFGGFGMARPKEIRKEGLSEYFLYTIEGTETIPDKWGKRLLSFDVDEVPVVNLYKYEQERYGPSVVRFLSFKNDEEHKLGETPIPGGTLKVYRSVDEQEHLGYVGQSNFKYIPVDEDVELNLGPVADVVVEPKLMDYRTENFRFDRRGNITGWDEIRKFKIEVRNTRELGVKVEIQRNSNTPYWKLEKSGEFDKFEKVDLDTVKFTLILEPRSVKKFEYILTTYHGARQEEISR
ncbi:MAG: DUF4139 domain-containing protein, partial [Planctomycetota bacterium]